MPERWSRRTVLATAMGGIAGCTRSSTGAGEGSTTTSPDASSAGTPTPSVEPRTFPDSYYGGPLVSAHEHMTGADGSARRAEVLGWYTRWMARNGVDRVMAITPPSLFGDVRQFTDRLIPYLFGGPFSLQGTEAFAARMQESASEHGFLQGFGEIGLYAHTGEDGLPLRPDMPQMLDLYDFAADHDMPVMIHAASPRFFPEEERQSWDSDLECPTIDQMTEAYEHNRNTEFLVHATYFNTDEMTRGEMAARAMENNPNLYYDISAIKPYGFVGLEGDGLTEEEFEARIEETGVEHHAEAYYQELKPVLKEHSDRVLWGMDAGLGWNYNAWALDTWIDVARSLLGRLSTADARNVGFRTAERLFDIEVDPQ